VVKLAAQLLMALVTMSGGASAQLNETKESPLARDTQVVRQLKDAVTSENRAAAVKTPSPNFGPLVFRLSTLRGLTFESTGKPLILVPPLDDGIPDRILGGIPATSTDFPWQVALLNSSNGNLFCGGSHIGNGWVLTAAHCFYDRFGQKLTRANVVVLLGSTSLLSGGARVNPITDPITHEQWNPTTKANDIALIRIATRATLATARIPSAPVEAPLISSGSVLTVSGWGTTTENGAISTELLKVNVPVTDLTTCAAAYPGIITSTQVCAGQTGMDSCQGDSGGPLTGLDGSGRLLVGVVSFGKGCGRAGYPGVYARTVAFRDWIRTKSGV